jgi:hypothetical protein
MAVFKKISFFNGSSDKGRLYWERAPLVRSKTAAETKKLPDAGFF